MDRKLKHRGFSTPYPLNFASPWEGHGNRLHWKILNHFETQFPILSIFFDFVANVSMYFEYISEKRGWNPPCLHFQPTLIHYHVWLKGWYSNLVVYKRKEKLPTLTFFPNSDFTVILLPDGDRHSKLWLEYVDVTCICKITVYNRDLQ